MGKSVAMYALDKVKTSIAIPAEVVVKLQKRAKERGVTLAQYINAMLFTHTHEDEWTERDEHERQRIVRENMRKREALKAKKGMK